MTEILTVDNIELLLTTEASVELVAVAEPALEVVEAGGQGPAGPQCLQGVSGGAASAVILAASIGGHRAVILTLAGAIYADAFSEADAGRVAGITTQAGSVAQTVMVQSSGPMTEPSWAWTPGADIWLGANGLPTNTVPIGAKFMQRLGYATSPTSIWVDISEPVIF